MYLTELKYIILILAFFNVFFQARKSYKRGLSKSLIKLSITVFCAFMAAVVAILIASFTEELSLNLLNQLGVYQAVEDSIGSAAAVTIILFNMLLSMELYLPSYVILRVIAEIVCAIIYKVLVKAPKKKEMAYLSENEESYVKRNKTLAAAVGVCSGIIVTLISFMPIVGALKTVEHVVDTVDHMAPDMALGENEIVEELNYYADDAAVNVLYICGGRLLFDLSTTTIFAGEITNLDKEITAINNIDLEELQQILSSISSMDEKSARSISQFLDRINESVILREMLVAVVKDSTSAWLEGNAYMGIERPNFDQHAAVDVFVDEVFYVFSTSTNATIKGDINTIVNISMILNGSEGLFSSGDYDAVIKAVVEDGILNKIKEELNKNSHMKTVAYAVDELVMSIVADEIQNTLEFTDSQSEELFEEIADILTSTAHLKGSAKTTAVSNYVKECLDSYGVPVPPELEDIVATILISGIDSTGGVDMDAVQDFFDGYNENMGKFQ